MTRIVSVLVSLLNFFGLIACCCNPLPSVVPPVVHPPPMFDERPRFVPPPQPPQQVQIPVPVDPPPVVVNKVDRPQIYDKDFRFTFLDLSNKGNIGRIEGTFFPDNH